MTTHALTIRGKPAAAVYCEPCERKRETAAGEQRRLW